MDQEEKPLDVNLPVRSGEVTRVADGQAHAHKADLPGPPSKPPAKKKD